MDRHHKEGVGDMRRCSMVISIFYAAVVIGLRFYLLCLTQRLLPFFNRQISSYQKLDSTGSPTKNILKE